MTLGFRGWLHVAAIAEEEMTDLGETIVWTAIAIRGSASLIPFILAASLVRFVEGDRTREQDVVLLVDVLVQVGLKRPKPFQQRAPGIAGIRWWGEVVCQRTQLQECQPGRLVLLFHNTDGILYRSEKRRAPGFSRLHGANSREEDLLLLKHVRLEFGTQRAEYDPALSHFRVPLAMSLFRFNGQLGQARQLSTQEDVVCTDNVLY
jgi:hypothetical protein